MRPMSVVLFVLLFVPFSQAQQRWERTYGGTVQEGAFAVQQTTDGGYIVAGSTTSFGTGGYDVYLIKTNAAGDTLWTRTYGGTGDDEGYSVQQTSKGGYIVAGITNSFGAGSYDVYLIKTNDSGDTLWTRTYGGADTDLAYSVQQTSDGGYIIAGATKSFGAGNYDVYLIKTNASGDTLWTRTYGGTGYDFGSSVQQTLDGGYIVAGTTYSFGAGGGDVYLIKTDASGDTLWTRTYGGTHDESGWSVQQTSDGGYIIAGGTCSFGDTIQVYLIKTDANGNVGTEEMQNAKFKLQNARLKITPNPFSPLPLFPGMRGRGSRCSMWRGGRRERIRGEGSGRMPLRECISSGRRERLLPS